MQIVLHETGKVPMCNQSVMLQMVHIQRHEERVEVQVLDRLCIFEAAEA